MKTLCMVRHAIAGERGPAWPDDALRPLTAEGKVRMEAGARGLARLITAEAILTSPLVRARETAEIVAAALGGAPIRTCEALASADHAALLAAAIACGAERVVAVGHEPYISMALSWLLAGDGSAMAFDVKKGSAALVRFDGEPRHGDGALEWFLPPRVLRDLGLAS